MGRKISLATANKLYGWLGVDSYKKLVVKGTLENFPTPGGHIRVDEDQVIALIERRPAKRQSRKELALAFDQVLRNAIMAAKEAQSC